MRRFETRHSQVLNPLGSCHQVAHLLRPRATFHPAAAKPLPHGVEARAKRRYFRVARGWCFGEGEARQDALAQRQVLRIAQEARIHLLESNDQFHQAFQNLA